MDIISRKEAKAQGLTRYFTGKPCKWGHICERKICSVCVECKRIANRNWRNDNRDKYLESSRRWYSDNREKSIQWAVEWALNNKEQKAATDKKWREENPDKNAAKEAKRRAAKLERTPSWLTKEDLEVIEFFYYVSHLAADFSDTAYDVDHTIPLQGELVSGLHTPENLKVMTASANRSKSNGFEPSD